MEKIKALIIGGNGFIGSNLCRKLADKGMEVYSFDMVQPHEPDDRINYIQGDFFDDNVLEKIIQNMDVIYHALSTINPGNSNTKYMMGYNRDFIQTVKLCSMLLNSKTKLIFLSSGGTVYGRQEVQPIKENAVAMPINHYGNVKLCIENTIRVFDIQANSKMVIARISNPYGPGQDFTKGVGFIDAVIKNAINDKVVEVWGNGEIIRDYIYIDDVCEMLYSLAEYEGEEVIFNLSSGVGTSQNQIISIVSKIVGEVKVDYKDARSVDVPKLILDNKKIKNILPINICNINDGIKKYCNYLNV